ncbi:MAG: HNH endonuclease [Armatimonadetes bacterium]|nr:HNH endonuclease [Armatimonadota bacterium]
MLKAKLFKYQLKENVCELCGQEPVWNGATLTLQIDHVNGDRLDNRLENLRILCPNCHSQTETFCGRNSMRGQRRQCPDCGTRQSKGSKRCQQCECIRRSLASRKITYPAPEELHALVWAKPVIQVARELGVSDAAVHKMCNKLGVEKPPQGYHLKGKPRARKREPLPGC